MLKLSTSGFEILNLNSIYVKECGGSIILKENASLYITSPNYPMDYPLNAECSYIIKVNVISLNFFLFLN